MQVEFHPEAEEEFIEEAAFYNAQVPGLGDLFVEEVLAAAALLQDEPKIGVKIFPAYRHFVLRKFPHSLIYSQEHGGVWILAVAHHKRRPGYWRERSNR